MGTTYTRKPPQPVQYDVEDSDNLYVTRMPSSTRRYTSYDATTGVRTTGQNTTLRRRSSLTSQNTNAVPSTAVALPRTEPPVARRNKHFPLIALSIGMLITILLLIGISYFQSWWQGYQDDVAYGYPRTYQFDAEVGHNDSSANPTHFILTNLKGRIEIIEIPGGDNAHLRAFYGPTLLGNGQDRLPVKGWIRDDQGKRDLVISIAGQQQVYINDGTAFHP
ncbi:hypothetical protein [Tengunoibacter tsumagoiensis]|uniref:Uncharacterized protein n=1 Tax=Tengunoibacter tsumagoiensis TaxID=2014871 RepID=A0A401ZUE2_9CHLR|nr:hypothetical protein [Tengunoibacter tsumagoiensis]GCE10491.1 hypothetical protein KTT_03500 [Tengunoibacter tsumagoiensis]